MPATTDTDETIFAVWFSTALLDRHLETLQLELRKLIQLQSVQDCGSEWAWEYVEPGLLDELHNVWEKWLCFFSSSRSEGSRLHWERTQEMRHAVFMENATKNMSPEAAAKIEGFTATERFRSFNENYRSILVQFNCLFTIDREKQANKATFALWEHELRDHLMTGIFLPRAITTADESSFHVNPTLFKTQEAYDLHYGTNSFSAFPLLLPSVKVSWVETCFGVFRGWIKSARRHRLKLKWSFSGLDCQTFCLNIEPSKLGLINTPGHDVPIQHHEPPRLSIGTLIVTRGLQKSPNLNGAVGIVTCRAPDQGRWGVRLIKLPSSSPTSSLPASPVSLKERNLSVRNLVSGTSKIWSRHAAFDVISTSNVADHIGLSTLLLISRPLLVAGGALLTTTFLHADSHTSTNEFLKSSLLDSDRTWWPLLFGFRPMGYESDHATSPSCKISFCEYEAHLASSHKDSTIVWLATNSNSNMALSKDGPIARHLSRYTKDTPARLRTSFNLHSKAIVMLHRHGCTYASTTAQKNYQEGDFLANVIRPADFSDVMLYGFNVEDDIIRRVFCSGCLGAPTPTMYIKVKATDVYGLWLGRTSVGKTPPTTRFFFWCSRKCVEEAKRRISLHSVLLGGLFEPFLDNIEVTQCDVGQGRVQRLGSILTGRGEFRDA